MFEEIGYIVIGIVLERVVEFGITLLKKTLSCA